MTWARYISEDLRMRISLGENIPEKLTLKTLSEQYAVSSTPVRIAIEQLLKEKYLCKGANNRLLVNHRKIGSVKKKRMTSPTPPRDHFRLIARDLIQLSLQGKAHDLHETGITEQYQIGSRLAREILNRLAGLGVVKHLPRRGWRLVPFDEKALHEYIDVRSTLEVRALELAMPYLVRADLEKLRADNIRQGQQDRPLMIDNALHRYILEKADNRYIQDFFDRHHPYFELLLDYETQHPGIRKVRQLAAKLHIEVLDALLANDLDTAKARLREDVHIQHPLLDMYRQARLDAVTGDESALD